MKNYQQRLEELRSGKTLPQNRNEYWPEDDDRKLVKLFYKPTGISEMAIILGRSEISIVNRIRNKGMLEPQSRVRNVVNGYNKKCKCRTCRCEDCVYIGACGLRAEAN